MVPTWLQNRPKLGPCWAPKPSWTRQRARLRRCGKPVGKKLIFGAILGPEKAKQRQRKGAGDSTRRGSLLQELQICKNCKNCHGVHHSCTPFGGAPDLRRPRGESPAPPPFCMELSPCPNEVVHFISVCMHFCIIAYMHTSIYAYNANWGASTKNRSKTNRKSLRNRFQNGPESVPNRSKIGPRSASEPTSLPRPFWDRF